MNKCRYNKSAGALNEVAPVEHPQAASNAVMQPQTSSRTLAPLDDFEAQSDVAAHDSGLIALPNFASVYAHSKCSKVRAACGAGATASKRWPTSSPPATTRRHTSPRTGISTVP